jgi:alkylhydroperoxidase/carboxymuconolactone decarboxylase family protein YurZ
MNFIDEFESHYNYDCNYMRKMLSAAPEAFQTFVDFLPMGGVGKSLPVEILWAAKISAMLTEDCGACVQLNIDMALESGVEPATIRKIVEAPQELEGELALVCNFAEGISRNLENFQHYQEAVEKKFSPEQLTELALAVASTKIYPTLKRALGEFRSCSVYQFKI